MNIVNLVTGIVILVLGSITRVFNLSGLVAGYNTSSREEKAKYDEKKMTRYVGNMMMLASLVLIISGLIFTISDVEMYAYWISWGVFTALILAGLVYLNTGNRLKIDKR